MRTETKPEMEENHGELLKNTVEKNIHVSCLAYEVWIYQSPPQPTSPYRNVTKEVKFRNNLYMMVCKKNET